jgi:ABC-type transport system involved in multi-copper enzyme maturation permease subunit
MLAAFMAEWPKIRRRSILLALIAMVGFTALAIGVTLARIHRRSLEQQVLINTDVGLTGTLQPSATLVSVIVLITIAAVLGADWTQGTWRSLLVQEPGRLRLLSGRVLALLVYMIISAVLTVGLGTLVAMVIAPHEGVNTAAWWDSTGTTGYFAFLGNLVLAVVGWTIFGTLVAVLVRNPAGAVGAAIAWLFVIEGLANQVWSTVGQYLPGRILSVVLTGGQASVFSTGASMGVSYTTALIIAGLYAIGMCVVAGASFWYRDITA